MEAQKTKMPDFIRYIEEHNLSTVRMLNLIKKHYHCAENVFLEDIRDNDFLMLQNCGAKTLNEFKRLKKKYVRRISTKRLFRSIFKFFKSNS
jgi:hypothetical protein